MWDGTTLKRFTKKQSPREESALKASGISDDQRDHQDSLKKSLDRLSIDCRHPLSLLNWSVETLNTKD